MCCENQNLVSWTEILWERERRGGGHRSEMVTEMFKYCQMQLIYVMYIIVATCFDLSMYSFNYKIEITVVNTI